MVMSGNGVSLLSCGNYQSLSFNRAKMAMKRATMEMMTTMMHA